MNLLSVPSKDMVLGVYYLTVADKLTDAEIEAQEEIKQVFTDADEVELAYNLGM